MKNIKILIVLMVFTTLGALINSCTKENDLNKEDFHASIYSITKGNVNPMTSNNVTVENGMLSFDSYINFDAIYKELKHMSSDSLYYANVYNELGYNTLGENGEEYHEPQNAVLDKFESRFQYLSFRKYEDSRFINFLNDGNDPKDFENSFLYDEFLMALLNEKMEVRIGGYYFKFIDDANVAVISDGNYNRLEALNGKTIFEIKNEKDLQIINFIDPGIPDIFVKDSEGRGIDMLLPCFPNFNFQHDLGHTWKFENTSFIPWACKKDPTLKYKWYFGDGTVYEGITPPPHSYNATGYPYSVTLQIIGNCCNKSITKVIDIACYEDFEVKHYNALFGGYANGNGVYFILRKPTSSLYNYHWDFGDGSTFDGHTNTSHYGWVSHVYDVSANDTYNVCLTITAKDGSCSQTICKKVYVGCGHVYATDDDHEDFQYDGRTWKLEGNIWCKNNFIYKTVGANSKSFRKGNLTGIWWRRKVDNLVVRLRDDFIDVNESIDNPPVNLCLQIDIDKTKSENNTSITEVLAEDYFTIHKPRFFDYHLQSYHKLKIGDKIVEIPTLYLVN